MFYQVDVLVQSICVSGWIDQYMDGWVYRWMNGWISGWMNGRMVDGWMLDRWNLHQCTGNQVMNAE